MVRDKVIEEKNYLISLILITYNRINVLIDCIDAINTQTYQSLEIILVDNSSSDGTSEIINNKYPDIKLIQAEKNLGVPGARNLAINYAHGDLLVFIDDDCIIKDRQFFEQLNRYFVEKKDVAILTFKIVNYFTNKVNRLEFPHRDKSLVEQEFETSYFLGTANAIRREVFELTGVLFADYFYGFEEIDFSMRALERGFRLFYSPQFVVYHKTSPEARPSWRSVYYFTRNRIWFAFSFLPWYFIVTHFIIWLSYYFLLSLKIKHPAKFFKGLADGVRGLKKIRQRRQSLKTSKTVINKLFQLKGRLLY